MLVEFLADQVLRPAKPADKDIVKIITSGLFRIKENVVPIIKIRSARNLENVI